MTQTPRGSYIVSTEAAWYPVTLANGQNVGVIGVAGERICVYAVFLSAANTVNITFQDGNNDFSGAMPIISLAFDTEDKPMICSIGNNFNITSTGAAAGMIFAAYAI
jgi:hypothetical protein